MLVTMSKITAIIGSPRKNGNCEAIVAKMVETAEAAGNTVDVFRINEIDAKGCQACMGCKKKPGICIRKDGMTPVLESVRDADSLILATPDYFGMSSAQFRIFQDRTYGFIGPDFKCMITPKKFVTITTCGGGLEGAQKISEGIATSMVNYFKCDSIGDITYSEAQCGPAKDNAEVMAKAEELAKKL